MITSTILGLLIPFVGTSLGAACVLFMKNELSVKTTKMLSGFAAGVMIAASVWSLLIPALEQSQSLGKMQFVPAVTGFMLGMFFLLILDTITPHMHLDNSVEGPKSNFSTDNDGACSYITYTGGHGSRSALRKLDIRNHHHHEGSSSFIGNRNSHTEFPGGRNHIHAIT